MSISFKLPERANMPSCLNLTHMERRVQPAPDIYRIPPIDVRRHFGECPDA
jgi:hypothetical protein